MNCRPFEPLSASVQEYDDQAYQNIYYVAESIDDAKIKLRFDRSWIRKKREEPRPNPKKNMVIGPYAGVDYNLTLCPLQSRLQHIYHGQTYAGVDFISQSGTLDLASEYEFSFP